MDRYAVINYKGNTYVCTEEPELIEVNEETGKCTFSGFKRLYPCDPDKNTKCKKNGCQLYCFKTFNKEFAVEEEI